jgi:hypothetical protein
VLGDQPVSSGGVQPVSIAVSRSGLVYVANSGAGGSGYSGFRLHLNGSLTAIPGTTVTVPDDAGLGDVFINATGDHLIGTRTGTSQIDSFVVLPGGQLLAAKVLPSPGRASASSAWSSRPSIPHSCLSVMNGWTALDRFLRTDPRDVRCAEAMELLHVYAELAAADASAAQRYPGIAAHLAVCGPCGEGFDGLLAAIRGTAE